jgi:hypothetical protein
MALDDDTTPDPVSASSPVMDSAMDTGSELGEPGDRPAEGPLTGEERALLDRLIEDEGPAVVTDAPEDSPAMARAVADDSVLPDVEVGSAGGPDADTPEFRGDRDAP